MEYCPHCEAPRFPDTTFCHRCLTPFDRQAIPAGAPSHPERATATTTTRPEPPRHPGSVTPPMPVQQTRRITVPEASPPSRQRRTGRTILRWTGWTLAVLLVGGAGRLALLNERVELPDRIAGMRKMDHRIAREFAAQAEEAGERSGLTSEGAVYGNETIRSDFAVVAFSGGESDGDTAADLLQQLIEEHQAGAAVDPATIRAFPHPRADFACVPFSGMNPGQSCVWVDDETMGWVSAFNRAPQDGLELATTVYDAVRG